MESNGLEYLKIIFFFVSICILISIIYSRIKKHIYKSDNDKQTIKKPKDYGRIISFTIENKTNSEQTIDLFELDKNSSDYSFFTSIVDYQKFIEYTKVYSLSVVSTQVFYDNDNWVGDILKLKTYTPFEMVMIPILVGIQDFQSQSETSQAISVSKYRIDYFNSIVTRLLPSEKKTINLFVIDEEIDLENEPIKCAMKIVNNTNKIQNVKLFDKNFMEDNQIKNNVSISSIFEINDYTTIVSHISQNHLVAKEVRVYAPKSEEIKYKVNFDEFMLKNVNSSTENEKYYYEIDFEERKYIHNFSIEVEPNKELIISFK